jgi:Ser-tRNA(Ala) deacylase AlaX
MKFCLQLINKEIIKGEKMRFYKRGEDERPKKELDEDLYQEIEDDYLASFMSEINGIDSVEQLMQERKNMNIKTLKIAIKLAKSSFLWRFKSKLSKLESIEEIYDKLNTILKKDEEDIEYEVELEEEEPLGEEDSNLNKIYDNSGNSDEDEDEDEEEEEYGK